MYNFERVVYKYFKDEVARLEGLRLVNLDALPLQHDDRGQAAHFDVAGDAQPRRQAQQPAPAGIRLNDVPGRHVLVAPGHVVLRHDESGGLLDGSQRSPNRDVYLHDEPGLAGIGGPRTCPGHQGQEQHRAERAQHGPSPAGPIRHGCRFRASLVNQAPFSSRAHRG